VPAGKNRSASTLVSWRRPAQLQPQLIDDVTGSSWMENNSVNGRSYLPLNANDEVWDRTAIPSNMEKLRMISPVIAPTPVEFLLRNEPKEA
jgi:hypothetical protein